MNESKIKSYSFTENVLFEIENIENKIKNIISSDLNIMPGGFNCITLGNNMGMHHDLYDFNFKEANKHYSIIIYLNDFEGGEIRYPELNLTYKPEAGDFIIHKCNLRHEVLPVKTDNRYTYTSFLWSKRNVI